MIEVRTFPGKTYAVTSANGCTVTTEDGTTLVEAEAGKQSYFVATGGKVQLSDDSAILTEVFKGAPGGGGAVKILADETTVASLASKAGNNVFTGSNVFNGALSGDGTLCGMPFGAAFGATSMYQGMQLSADEFMQLFPDYANMEVWPGLDCLSSGSMYEKMPKLKYVYIYTAPGFHQSVTNGLRIDKLKEFAVYHSGNGWVQTGFTAAAERSVFILPEYENTSYDHGYNFNLSHNTKESNVFIYAPKLPKIEVNYNGNGKSVTVTFLGKQVFEKLVSKCAADVQTALVTLKGFNSTKCVRVQIQTGIDKDSILELLGALPAYDAATMTDIPTCELYVRPEYEGDEEITAALMNLQTAVEDGGKGWTVAVTGITLGGAATFGLRKVYYYARREDADGSYIDSTGQRWDVSGGTTVLRNYEANEQVAGYASFLSLEDALEQWGLHEITPEESKADYERRYGAV